MSTGGEVVSGPWGTRPAGEHAADLFDRDGLRAQTASRLLLERGRLRWGTDHRFWAYTDGAWRPGDDLVHAWAVTLFGERYKPGHETTVREVLRAVVPRLAADPVPDVINFRNGLLDWRRGELRPHDPDVLTTVQLPVQWRPDAECPHFDRFLAEVVAADDVQRAWEIIGYLMMSGNPLHRAIMLYGSGRNGKGVLLRVLNALLGTDNCVSVPLHELAENRFATAQLYGVLANLAGDIDAGYIERTGRLKELTGGDVVFAERKHRDPFTYRPWATLVFSANELPASGDASTGWRDRWEVIEFPHYFGDRRDVGLADRLAGELPGIAVRAVTALRALMARGEFARGESARRAQDAMLARSNPALAWLRERTEPDPHPRAWERRSAVWDDYTAWAEDAGLRRLTKPRFFSLLRQLHVTEAKREGIVGFAGVTITRGQDRITDVAEPF